MPAFHELEGMIRRVVAQNDGGGETGDGSKLAQLHTEDAIHSWSNGPNWEFVARGRKQILEWGHGHGDGRPRGLVLPVRAHKGQKLKPAMLERMQKSSNQPGWVRRSSGSAMSATDERDSGIRGLVAARAVFARIPGVNELPIAIVGTGFSGIAVGVLWPDTAISYGWRTRPLARSDYELVPPSAST